MKPVRLPAPVLRAASPVIQLWWKVRKPKTFGVKVLLRHPDGSGGFLTVRHSYADTRRWGLPGGGYNPARETPQQAASREIAEELGVEVAPEQLARLDTVATTLEAKRDTLTIFAVTAPADDLRLSPELAEARWIKDVTELGEAPVSRWLLAAIAIGGTAEDATEGDQDAPERRARAFAASAALIRNQTGGILMVQPTYKESLELPGGYVEVGEYPVGACLREVREELGIDIELGELLAVDWAPAPREGEKILFIFDGGQLTADQESAINLREKEVTTYGYYDLAEIEQRTPPRLSRRIVQAAAAKSSRYLEDGDAVAPLPDRFDR